MAEKFAALLVLCCVALAPLSLAMAQTATLAPVEIPVLLPLTGNAAFYGATVQRTMQAAETAANAEGGIRQHSVKFVFYDDQANPSTTVQLFGTIPKNTPIVFDAGPVATCRASAAAIKDGPVLYCLSALYEPPRGSYFSLLRLDSTMPTKRSSDTLLAEADADRPARQYRRLRTSYRTDFRPASASAALSERIVSRL